jgi:phosphotransferase system enzyme I (PtsI)
MMKFNGKGVYSAVATGKIAVLRQREKQVHRIPVQDTAAEKERFASAKKMALKQLSDIHEKALGDIGETGAQIFEIHMMMIEDDDYNSSVNDIIENEKVNAEYAVSVTSDNLSEMFAAIDDSYMRERAADVRDISNRLIDCLSDVQYTVPVSDDKIIVCADDLAPSETVLLDRERVLAFVTAHGAPNSHTAILARSMNIPAVIGVGDAFLSFIKNGDTAVVDGYTGEVYINPDETVLSAMENKRREALEENALLQKLRGKENVTLDGRKINIYANIGSVDDITSVLRNDADGIGLFRSEFLYLENKDYPTEEQQFHAYKKVLNGMEGKMVIIRTLDIGADKRTDYFQLEKEENPALGLRAIRFCLTRPEIFRTQLRALYRASVYGKLGIMFPMITSTRELEQILAICTDVRNELTAEGVAIAENTALGIMIETPAAALISDKLAPMVDFFSVGTNDLTQYTLAYDRQNPRLEDFCDPHHEAILRLIEMSAVNAHRHGIWIGICGELAADTTLTEVFLRMGIDELSVSPSLVLRLRDTVRSISLSYTDS